MAQGSGTRRDAAIAWVVVAFVQMAIGGWLLHLRAPVAGGDTGDALTIEFIHKPKPHAVPAGAVSRRAMSHVAGGRRVARIRSAEAGGGASARTSGGDAHPAMLAKPLDLRAPVADVLPSTQRNAFERPPALEVRRTRFAGAWVPEGDALRQASFRSAEVGVLTGAFGGPPRRCNEIERRLRKVNCLPLHGQDDADEALRRSLDP